MAPADIVSTGQGLAAARPRRRGFPVRSEVDVPPGTGRRPALPLHQLRRSRARHVQGPPARRLRSAPRPRRHRDRVLRVPSSTPRTSSSAASTTTRRRSMQKAIDEAYETGIFGGRACCAARATSRSSATSTAAPARTSAAKRPALLEAIEGKRGWPRIKPPFPAVKGLFGRPTIVNNVETLAAVGPIVEYGAEVVDRHGRASRRSAVRRATARSSWACPAT